MAEFGSDAVEAEMRSEGYAILPVFDSAEIESLRDLFGRLGPAPDDGCLGWSFTDGSGSVEYQDAVHAALDDIVTVRLADAIGAGHEGSGGFAVTWPGPMSGRGLHRGDSTDDEGGTGSVTVLVSLDTPDAGNGDFWVVPRSHRWPQRDVNETTGNFTASRPAAERIVANHAVRIRLPIGHAVVLDSRLVRFSTPNPTDRPHLAVVARIPVEYERFTPDSSTAATQRHPLDLDDLDKLAEMGLLVASTETPSSTLNATVLWCRSCGSTELDGAAPDPLVGVVDEVCRACRSGDGTGRARPIPSEQRSPARGGVTPPGRSRQMRALTRSLLRSPSPIMATKELNDRLLIDGYAATRQAVISPDRAIALREQFGELHGWSGTGFHNDFNHRDRIRRRRAASLISEALDDVAQQMFVGYEPFLHAFLAKWPDAGSYFEPHCDWMYVDEATGDRTFVFFVALEDVVNDNGVLRMLPGSHDLDRTALRGTNLYSPSLRHEHVIEQRLVDLPVQRGFAAIWDNATIHASRPNESGTVRVAASVWMKPVGSRLVHYRRTTPHTASRFDLDSDFFLRGNPYSLMVAPPPGPAAAVDLPAGEDRFTADELADRLDRKRRSSLRLRR